MRIDEIASKFDVTEDFLKKVIVYNHEIKHLISKKQLKTVKFQISPKLDDFMKKINKLAKVLKVSVDSIIVTIVVEQLRKDELNDKKKI